MAEALFAILECELLDRRRVRNQFHNPTRRHSALGELSPIEYEAGAMAMSD